MKLTIMQMWRIRCRRVKRMNCRSATSPFSIGVRAAGRSSKSSPLGIGVLLFPEFRRGLRFRGAQLAAHLEGPGQPEQRMHATDQEGPQQQPGHSPEGVEHKRIFLWIVVRGMRQVTGEAAGRARMALLASGRDVGTAEVRAWVGYLEHVVRSVAVIALS